MKLNTRRRALGLIGVVVLSLSVAVIVIWRRAEKEHQRAETRQYFNLIGLAHGEWSAKEIDRGAQLLEECQPLRRHWEW